MHGSLHVVNGPATSDFPGCASAVRALGVTSMFGVKTARVPKLNFAYQLISPTQSLVDPHSPDSRICFASRGDGCQVGCAGLCVPTRPQDCTSRHSLRTSAPRARVLGFKTCHP